MKKSVPEDEIRAILARTGKRQASDELNCRACGYESCRDKAIAVYHGIAEVDMCLPYMISRLETSIIDLKESQTRLIQAEKLASMGQMAAGIAHELNNPLGVVLMYSHLLMGQIKTNLDEHSLEDVERIVHEAERARSIVQGILNFSRENRLELQSTDINDLIRQAARDAASMELAATISIELGLDDSLKAQNVDPSQLRQVLDNLLKNAVEAIVDGGTIRIESERLESEFRISVSDNGPGIPGRNTSPSVHSLPYNEKAGQRDRSGSGCLLRDHQDAQRIDPCIQPPWGRSLLRAYAAGGHRVRRDRSQWLKPY
jgi:C4-dicarboxylate-specific signal transduction histidine kinase